MSKLSHRSVPAAKPREARRGAPVIVSVVVGILLVGGAIAYKKSQTAPVPATIMPPGGVSTDTLPEIVTPAPTPLENAAPQAANVSAPPVPSPEAAPPLVDPKQSLANLASLDGNAAITSEQARLWKQALQDLVRQGPAAIPVIQEFLSKNQDVSYAEQGAANPLGYATLRAALIDSLAQIGGADALAVLTQTLQTSPYPTDLAALSKALDPQGPQYAEAILGAARQQLSVAAQGQLGGADVGPLYQILASQAANGVDVTAELQQYGSKWPYYTAIALANLPGGSGLTELIQMAQAAAGNVQNPAAEALSEMTGDDAQARSTLLDMAKNNQLPDWLVARMTPFLGGAQYQIGQQPAADSAPLQSFHVSDGNQNFAFYTEPNLSAPEINQRINFIDQMLQALSSQGGPSLQSLQQQRSALAARLSPPLVK